MVHENEVKWREQLPLVRESERVLARLKATWYTGLKLILFINTPGTFCAREQKGL